MNFAAEVACFSRIAEEKGLVNSLEGNLSMIDRETGNIYITPSHKMKCLLTEEQRCQHRQRRFQNTNQNGHYLITPFCRMMLA